MLTYVVIAHKHGQPLTAAHLRHLDQPDVPELFFEPDGHIAWVNQAGTIGFFGWQSATSVAGIGSHWHTRDNRLVAFSGHPWPRTELWRSGKPWADGLADYLRGRRGSDANEEFLGCYSIVEVDSSGGTVMSDPFSGCPVFMGEDEEIVALSNRATLAARAMSGNGLSAPRSPTGVGWLPYFAHSVGTATSIEGVSTLSTGVYVHLDGGGRPTTRPHEHPVWRFPDPQGVAASDREELIDTVLADLIANIRSAARLDTPRKVLRLSGGKDSRLVLALIAAAGVQDRFTCATVGPSHSADVVVARWIAEEAGIELAVNEPTPSRMTPEEFERRVRTHVFQTSGMLGAFTLKGGLRYTQNLVMSGLFGELFRSHYAKNHTIGSVEEAYAFFREILRFDDGCLLRDEVRREYASIVERWLEHRLEAEGSPEDLPDIFYIEHRLRRWFGTAHELGGMSPQVAPLQTLVGTRAAFMLGHRVRQTDFLHFELTRRASEPLAKLPLANQSWHPETYRHLPVADEYAAIEPYRVAADRPPQRWQLAKWNDNLPVVRDHLSSPTHPIYEVLDHSRVMAALDKPGSLHAREQLYGALAGAIWLEGTELPIRIGS